MVEISLQIKWPASLCLPWFCFACSWMCDMSINTTRLFVGRQASTSQRARTQTQGPHQRQLSWFTRLCTCTTGREGERDINFIYFFAFRNTEKKPFCFLFFLQAKTGIFLKPTWTCMSGMKTNIIKGLCWCSSQGLVFSKARANHLCKAWWVLFKYVNTIITSNITFRNWLHSSDTDN